MVGFSPQFVSLLLYPDIRPGIAPPVKKPIHPRSSPLNLLLENPAVRRPNWITLICMTAGLLPTQNDGHDLSRQNQ